MPVVSVSRRSPSWTKVPNALMLLGPLWLIDEEEEREEEEEEERDEEWFGFWFPYIDP